MQYRDRETDWQLVWRSACLFTAVEPDAQRVFQVQECQMCQVCHKCQTYKDARDLFESGGMDRQLLSRCRDMSPGLDVL